mgnify:CR=1 FL=1
MSIERSINTIFGEWLFPNKFTLAISNEIHHETSVLTECSYTLDTSIQSNRYTGQKAYNCNSSSQCKNEINQYCQETSQGGNERVNSLAIKYIHTAAIASFNSIKAIDQIERSYLERCNNCDGDGKNRCNGCGGTGQSHCYSCNNGRATCSGCNGQGRFVSGSVTTSCNNCGGNGSVYCYNCGGTTVINCSGCGGGGNIPCAPCNQQGWFTNIVTATCKLVSSEQVNSWSVEDGPNWLVNYIDKSMCGKTPQAPFNDTVSWDLSGFQLDAVALPFKAEIRGKLYSSSADIAVDQYAERSCQFVGTIPIAHNLNCIMDEPLKSLITKANHKKGVDELKALFKCRVAKHNLAEYQSVSRPNNFITHTNLLSSDSCQTLKNYFSNMGRYFKNVRSYIKISHLILFTLLFSVIGLLMMGLVKTFVSGIHWEQLSLFEIIKATPEIFKQSWFLLLNQPMLFFLILYAFFIPSMLLMRTLSSGKVSSFMRMNKWFVFCSLILMIFIYQGISMTPDLALLQWNKNHFFDIMESLIQPDIIMEVGLIVLLPALLKARREAFKTNKRLVRRIKSTELNELLEYE